MNFQTVLYSTEQLTPESPEQNPRFLNPPPFSRHTDKETKKQRPKRDFNIVMPGQFRTLVMFYVWFVSRYLLCRCMCTNRARVVYCRSKQQKVMTKIRKREEVLAQMFPIYIWLVDEMLWTMHTMLPWGFPNMKTSSQYLETTK